MTVCLATFAEKSKAIVLVSDKAVTYGGTDQDSSGSGAMQYDTGVKKVKRVGDTLWYALLAGDPTFAVNVIDAAEQIIAYKPDLPNSAIGMMSCFKAAYKKRREELVSDRVLAPRLLTKDLLVARTSDLLPLDQEFLFAVSAEAKNLKTHTSLLVCGFDSNSEGHIFSVVNPGVVNNHDLVGFHAVGVGAKMAISRLLTLEAEKDDHLGLALFQAFDAKVNAEITQGVGYNWDAEILISGKKAVPLRSEMSTLVENIFSAHPYTPLSTKQYEFPKRWQERLSTYCDHIMGHDAKPRHRSKSRTSKSKR
jgi:20S proteasome alpha/beta subunit